MEFSLKGFSILLLLVVASPLFAVAVLVYSMFGGAAESSERETWIFQD